MLCYPLAVIKWNPWEILLRCISSLPHKNAIPPFCWCSVFLRMSMRKCRLFAFKCPPPWRSKLSDSAALLPFQPVDKPTSLMGYWELRGIEGQSGHRSEHWEGHPCPEGKEQSSSWRQMRMLHWYWQDDGMRQGHFRMHQNISKFRCGSRHTQGVLLLNKNMTN